MNTFSRTLFLFSIVFSGLGFVSTLQASYKCSEILNKAIQSRPLQDWKSEVESELSKLKKIKIRRIEQIHQQPEGYDAIDSALVSQFEAAHERFKSPMSRDEVAEHVKELREALDNSSQFKNMEGHFVDFLFAVLNGNEEGGDLNFIPLRNITQALYLVYVQSGRVQSRTLEDRLGHLQDGDSKIKEFEEQLRMIARVENTDFSRVVTHTQYMKVLKDVYDDYRSSVGLTEESHKELVDIYLDNPTLRQQDPNAWNKMLKAYYEKHSSTLSEVISLGDFIIGISHGMQSLKDLNQGTLYGILLYAKNPEVNSRSSEFYDLFFALETFDLYL